VRDHQEKPKLINETPNATTRVKMPAKQEGLARLNRDLEENGELPLCTWHRWLWRCDPQDPLTKKVPMNEMHLLGLLLCRFWTLCDPTVQQAMQNNRLVPSVQHTTWQKHEAERLILMQKTPEDMTLRELRDTVDNLAIEFPAFAARLHSDENAREHMQAIEALVTQCFTRLGTLAAFVHSDSVLDDPVAAEQTEEGVFKLTKAFIRRSMCTFLALFRNIYMWKNATHVASGAAADVASLAQVFKKHHVEASNDDFHLLCMYATLPIGALLTYKTDFPGMYNHISQVVYFHNSKYERKQRPKMEEIPAGDPLHVLPAIMQLHPDIALVYESDDIDVTMPSAHWKWAVFPGMIYLIDPDANVYHSPNILQLYWVYLERQRENQQGHTHTVPGKRVHSKSKRQRTACVH